MDSEGPAVGGDSVPGVDAGDGASGVEGSSGSVPWMRRFVRGALNVDLGAGTDASSSSGDVSGLSPDAGAGGGVEMPADSVGSGVAGASSGG